MWTATAGGFREAVWDEGWLPAATGGGRSTVYPRPAYQNSVASVVGNHRGVPDLSWNAAVNGGVLTYQSFFPESSAPGFYIYGGTSASSPQAAALTAVANRRERLRG